MSEAANGTQVTMAPGISRAWFALKVLRVTTGSGAARGDKRSGACRIDGTRTDGASTDGASTDCASRAPREWHLVGGVQVRAANANPPENQDLPSGCNSRAQVPPGTREGCLQSTPLRIRLGALIASHGSLYSVLNSWILCTETREMPEKKHK